MGLSLENVLDTVNMELVFNVVSAALAMAGAWVNKKQNHIRATKTGYTDIN